MPLPVRLLRQAAGAAISLAAACAIGAPASAQVPAPLFIGPDRVGTGVTYRLTTSGGPAGSAPNIQTLVLRWKLGQKVVVTLTSADDAQPTPFVATRAADGTLTLDNVGANDPETQRIVVFLGVLNRLDGFVAAAPAGAKTWKTTLTVQPSTPAAQLLNIPVDATRSDDASGTTLAASGSIARAVSIPASGEAPRGGGRMGGNGGGGRGGMGGGIGGGMGGGMGGDRAGGSFSPSSGPRSTKVMTKIAVDTHFGRNGELTSATIVETNQSARDQSRQNQEDQPSEANPQSQPSTRSWQIDRTP